MSPSPPPASPHRLVLTVLGPDRPGLVADVASAIAAAGGNWMESRMVRLGGQFAGLVEAEIPAHARSAVDSALEDLRGRGLRLTVEAVIGPDLTPGPEEQELRLELLTPDRPGILREVTTLLAQYRLNVEELATGFEAAPWSGELLFRARLRVRGSRHAAVDVDALRQAIEDTAAGMMLDLTVAVR
ncbi:MAG: glycine cleavage system protein R [Opitutales bacterium]